VSVVVPSFPLLLVNVAGGGTLLGLGLAGDRVLPESRRGRTLLALAPALDAVLLTVYVFGEDAYRRNGISRWNAYRSPGGELGEVFVACVALLACTTLALLVCARADRRPAYRLGLAGGGLTMLLVAVPTIVGFNAN
jgi:hypothetical protein